MGAHLVPLGWYRLKVVFYRKKKVSVQLHARRKDGLRKKKIAEKILPPPPICENRVHVRTVGGMLLFLPHSLLLPLCPILHVASLPENVSWIRGSGS